MKGELNWKFMSSIIVIQIKCKWYLPTTQQQIFADAKKQNNRKTRHWRGKVYTFSSKTSMAKCNYVQRSTLINSYNMQMRCLWKRALVHRQSTKGLTFCSLFLHLQKGQNNIHIFFQWLYSQTVISAIHENLAKHSHYWWFYSCFIRVSAQLLEQNQSLNQ